MGSKYSVEIVNVQADEVIVRASGSLKLAAAAIKEGLAEIAGKDGDFHATSRSDRRLSLPRLLPRA